MKSVFQKEIVWKVSFRKKLYEKCLPERNCMKSVFQKVKVIPKNRIFLWN